MASQLTLDPRTFVVLDADREITDLLGLAREKLVGRSFLLWIDEPNPNDLSNALRVCFRNGQPRQFRVALRGGEGRLLSFELSAQPYPRDLVRPVLKLSLAICNEISLQAARPIRTSSK